MNDIISAISTPWGKGGVAMIRISGEGSDKMCETIFRPKSGKPLGSYEPNKAIYGEILYEGEVIDDGMATIFRAPHSFTGEDTVEICCHGGILLTDKVLRSTYLCGARPAEAGEFTKRAFINGKLSLSEAEAVIDLIDAESTEQIRLARSHVSGVLSRRIAQMKEKIISLLSKIYVFIDYPDEDLSDVSSNEAISETEALLAEAKSLLSTYETGKAISEGIAAVICGKPNTGKSSLLNALSGNDRAIVTDIPGTTRDTVEEKINIGRLTLSLCDTAGIHETDDKVERLGIERSIDKIKNAQLSLCVFDGSRLLSSEDKSVLDKQNPEKTIIVVNKIDIGCVLTKEEFSEFNNIVFVSAKEHIAIEPLRNLIENLFIKEKIDYKNDAIISNARQFSALLRAIDSIENAKTALEGGYTPDVSGMELELALSALGEVDSRKVSEDVVNAIFSRFCVGK